jgi:hypothetical protein
MDEVIIDKRKYDYQGVVLKIVSDVHEHEGKHRLFVKEKCLWSGFVRKRSALTGPKEFLESIKPGYVIEVPNPYI